MKKAVSFLVLLFCISCFAFEDSLTPEETMKGFGANLVGKFMFMNQQTGKVLEAITTGTHETLIQTTSTGAESQIFSVYKADSAYYFLAANGHALTLDNFGAGNVVVFSPISKDQAQTWSYTLKSGSWGSIQSTITEQAIEGTTVAKNILTVFPNTASTKSTQMWGLIKSAC